MIDRACISLNNNCNLKCKYCHFQDKQKNYSSFSFDELKIIADNIHNYCLKQNVSKFKLGIVGSGEPMLKKEVIIELLDYIREKEYKEFSIYTITNGTLLDENLLNKFYQYKDLIKICFSLDGYRELHNYGRMQYDKVMNAIELYKKIYNCSPAINATVNKISYLNMEKLVDFFKKHDLINVTFSKIVGYFNNDLYITNEEYKLFLDFVKQSGLNSRQFRKEKLYDCTMYGNLCGVGRTNIFISPEGIYPCGRFYKNNKYLIGEYFDSLEIVENNLKELKPVQDGKCYYIEQVEGVIV